MNTATGTIYSLSTAINMSIKCCTYWGKRYVSKCGLRNHPDANDDMKYVTTDLIISRPSIKHFDLLLILNDYITTIPCCEICSNVEAAAATSDKEMRHVISRDTAQMGDTCDKETKLYPFSTPATQETWRHSLPKLNLLRTTSSDPHTATRSN